MIFQRKQLIVLSAALLLVHFLLGYIFRTPEQVPLIAVNVLVGLGIIATTVFHLGYLIQFLLRRTLSFVERLTLGVVAFFIVFPGLLYLLFLGTHSLFEGAPIFICIVFFLVTAGIEIYEKEKPQKIILNGLFLKISLLFIGAISILVLSYQALPDLDPYGWIQTLEPQFKYHLLPPVTERPFFAALIYGFISILRIDIFTFFKYVFPFLSVTILLPLWLVIRNTSQTVYKVLFLLYLLAVPSTALYMTTPTPQAILIILSVYAAMFLLYSKIKNNSLYFFSAGIILLFSFFYHQASSILFFPWFVASLFAYRKKLFSTWKNLVIAGLFLVVSYNHVKGIVNFVSYWAKGTYARFFASNNINFHYPAQYVNIDQNEMGWPGLTGVLKFYSYYASPLVLLVIILSCVVLFYSRKKKIVGFFLKKEYMAITLILSLFVIIAEVLPRFPNIALLPERAWIFVSIFTLPLFFFLIHIVKTKQKERAFILIASFFLVTGILGTFYINSLKRFLITPPQITSAHWIKQNLPKNKMIFGYDNGNLILFHAKSPYMDLGENILCSDLSLQDTLGYLEPSKEQVDNVQNIMDTTARIRNNAEIFLHDATQQKGIESSQTILSHPSIKIIQELTQQMTVILDAERAKEAFARSKGIPVGSPVKEIKVPEGTPKFIYFAPKDERNPYNTRGYHPEHWGVSPCENNTFLFDKYPQAFERIYNQEGIIIWKAI
jgi:hypothetical protein